MLSNFAGMIAQIGNGSIIHSIFDQYVNFASPEPHLFTLFEDDHFMNDIFGFKSSDEKIKNGLDMIADGLTSVFLTAGEIPRVLFQNNNEAAKMLVKMFINKIKPLANNFELWESRRNNNCNYKPPLLVIFDRTADLASQLHHPCYYQALIHDNYGIIRNEVSINETKYDLDCDIDKFWNSNKSETFDTVADMIGKEVNDFIKIHGSIEDDLSNAINNLPELSHKRLSLQTHTKIAHDLLERIKKMKLDELFKFEEDMFLQNGIDTRKLIEFLETIPNEKDRIRCASIGYLCNIIPNNEIKNVENVVGSSLDFLTNYCEKFKIITSSNKKGNIGKLLSHVGRFGTKNDFNELAEKLPIVEMTRRMLEESIDGFCLMNVQTGKTEQPTEIGNVYVFIIGPGNYVEFNGLLALANKNKLELTYGCTSMMRPNEFLSSLQNIGN